MLKLKNLFRRPQAIADDLKSVTEVAGDQIAPGAGTLLLVLAGAAIGAAGAYYVSRKRKNKKAASNPAASSKSDTKS
ncbi:MAG TPA: LPXTG cell wall anchor domain-containing protein [Rhizomicrobium sp.]|nr:LPXTG cell wall anchor domain-containing protein [Rhizomicrobium sp.]